MSEIKPNEVYRAELKIIAPDTDDIILKGPKVESGRVLVICFMAVMDITTKNKTMRLGYEKNGKQYWFRRRPAGSNTYGVTLDNNIILSDGEQPICMVESPTAANEIWFFAHGAYGMHF